MIKMRMLRAAATISALIFAGQVLAEVNGSKNMALDGIVAVVGEITPADAAWFENYKRRFKPDANVGRLSVGLNTVGGDLSAALRIGSVLRAVDATAVIMPGGKCFSSCVFVLAGAPRRIIWGSIGIHRPYLPQAVRTDPDQEKVKYTKMKVEVEKYLDQMNVDARLWADMLLISPEKMKILTTAEINSYGLGQDDVYVQESDAMRQALALGISRMELGIRKNIASNLCPDRKLESKDDLKKWHECYTRVLKTGK